MVCFLPRVGSSQHTLETLAEGMPQIESSPFAQPLAWVTRCVVRWPKPVLIGCVLVAAAALSCSVACLEFRTSRLDLVDPDCDYGQCWLNYVEAFGHQDDAIVVVEGDDTVDVIAALDEISLGIAGRDHLFHSVVARLDLTKIKAKGLYYLSREQLAQVDHYTASLEPICRDGWGSLAVGAQLHQLSARLPAVAGAPADDLRVAALVGHLDRFATGLGAALAEVPEYRSVWPTVPALDQAAASSVPEYLLAEEGRLGFVLLRLRADESDFEAGAAAIDSLREVVADVQRQHNGVSIGLTGLPVIETDEMRGAQATANRAMWLSLVGVTLLFVISFGGWRHPGLAIAALTMGVLWSIGYATLSVGHLNIFSVSFGVILIGLGIDFAIHFVARYLQLRRDTPECEAALVATAGSVGPGILTGAVTSAIAFFAATLTDFQGIVELGWIAGGGIVMCCAAALVALPAMICLLDRRNNATRPAPPMLQIASVTDRLVSRPRTMLFVVVAVGVVLAPGLSRVWYDHNLLNLQAKGVESVELERQLLGQSDHSLWYAVSVCDTPAQLFQRKQQYEALETVTRTEEILSALPSDVGAKTVLVSRVATRLHELPPKPPYIPVEENVRDLAAAVAATARQLVSIGGGQQCAAKLGEVSRQLSVLPSGEVHRRLSAWQQAMAEELLERLHTIRRVANPVPPVLDDLPSEFVSRFVNARGQYVLRIYGDGELWDMGPLGRFVSDVKRVDPLATGQPVWTYEASKQMKSSYQVAAVYASLAIFVVLLLDFRNLRDTLLAVLPVALGMFHLLATLGWLGIPLNPANMIVLPLILGIGVDDGVHVVHDFRRQRGRYRLSNSTAMAVLVTSLTTMVGFGSLMIATHRGQESLGRVLVIGVAWCLIDSIVVLPAVLKLVGRPAEQPDEYDLAEPTIAVDDVAPEAEETPARQAA
jgi:hopanoid biosynthesis associated RND transporter like protein HpnN